MKQGRASRSNVASTKVEPTSHAVPPAFPAQMGRKQGNHSDTGTHRVQKIPMYEGRGLKAPMKGIASHPKGSQGSH